MTDLALHSPSPIVGTPFATSARFEYPFPDCSASSSSLAASLASSSSSPGSHSSCPLNFPISLPPSVHFHRPFAFVSQPSLSSAATNSHSPTHPKLRLQNPPVPPTLIKKRIRWNLSYLARKKETPADEAASSDTSAWQSDQDTNASSIRPKTHS
ncbi:hypothetical protein APHAL10511_005023 [Amanita phalloides]|nr:hypothetical protein APHAL10511_005023 [Amanita phalloides]